MTAWLMCVILKKLLHFIATGAGCTASMVGTVKGSKSDPSPVTTSLPVPDKECALFCFQELLSYQMMFWSSGIADQLKGLKKDQQYWRRSSSFLFLSAHQCFLLSHSFGQDPAEAWQGSCKSRLTLYQWCSFRLWKWNFSPFSSNSTWTMYPP